MAEYPNWFMQGGAEHNFNKFLVHLAGKELHCLQIGAYTGDATEWLFSNILTNSNSTLTDVDTWEGSDEPDHEDMNWNSVHEVYLSRHIGKSQLTYIQTTSDQFFKENSTMYDFIYIDGDHKASSVLKDGVNAIPFLKQGGIIAFDDYMWGLHLPLHIHPRPAIDAIKTCYADQFEIMDVGLQVWLRAL
jgi:predicted O-methyltransferase YrrM